MNGIAKLLAARVYTKLHAKMESIGRVAAEHPHEAASQLNRALGSKNTKTRGLVQDFHDAVHGQNHGASEKAHAAYKTAIHNNMGRDQALKFANKYHPGYRHPGDIDKTASAVHDHIRREAVKTGKRRAKNIKRGAKVAAVTGVAAATAAGWANRSEAAKKAARTKGQNVK